MPVYLDEIDYIHLHYDIGTYNLQIYDKLCLLVHASKWYLDLLCLGTLGGIYDEKISILEVWVNN
jgi:hypothetical protein